MAAGERDLGLPHVPKTSGTTGLQVFIPLGNVQGITHDYESTRSFTTAVAQYLLHRLPRTVTLERFKKNRGNKVYIDYPQHRENRTLIAAYSDRATKYATVSTPLTWLELERGAVPEDFPVLNVADRLRQTGELMDCGPAVQIPEITRFLQSGRSKHTARPQLHV